MIFTCWHCLKKVDLPVTFEQVKLWNEGALSQDAFAHIPRDDREIIISHTCSDCFDNLFKNDDDEF